MNSNNKEIKDFYNILICDTSLIFSNGLAGILKNDTRVHGVYTTAYPDEAKKLMNTITFNAIIIEDTLASGSFEKIFPKIKKLCSSAHIIISSNHNEPSLIKNYLVKGVNNFIPKLAEDQIILDTIFDVMNDKKVDNTGVTQKLKTISGKKYLEIISTQEFGLNPQEREILYKITEGKSNKEIAHELSIKVKTVEHHKTKIYKKTNSNSLADLVMLTIASRLL